MRRHGFASLLAYVAAACSSQHAAVPGPARTAASHAAAGAGSVEGVWTVVEQASRAPGGDWVSAFSYAASEYNRGERSEHTIDRLSASACVKRPTATLARTDIEIIEFAKAPLS